MLFLTSIYINLMLASFYQVKKVTYYFTIFLFSILFFSFSSFASCIKIEDDKFVFLPPDDTICTDKATGGILKLYSNPDSSASDNKLDTIIEGRSDTGYSIHFTFDRDESDNLSGDQILFAAYENMSDGTAVAKAGIRSGEFFYEIGSEEINGVNMNALNDVSVSNPHIAIIVYDSRRQKVILNIDGAEVISENIKPISGISKISRIEFGQGYTGEMGMMYTYATKLSIDERVELVGMLAQSVNTKVIKPKIDERGVLVSGVDKEASVQCRPGKIFINGNCQNAVISGFTAPLNSAYDGDSNGDITYDPAHKGMDNAKLLDCNIGYEVGSVSPKYWFTLNGDLPSVHTEGSCVARNYSANFLGIAGISNDLTSVIYSNSSNTPLPCQSDHYSHSEDGYSFDNVTGDITVDSDSGGCIAINYVFGDPVDITPISASGFYIDGVLKTKDKYNTNDYLVLPSAAIDGKFDPVSGDKDFYTISGFHYDAGLGLSGYLNDSINSNSRHIYVIFYLDNLYDLSQLKIWNWGFSSASSRSLLEADMYLSTDNGNSWGSANTMNFSVRTSDTPEIKTLTGPANAVKVRFKKNGRNTWVGFDEIKFVAASKLRDYRSEFTGISNIKTTDPIVIYNSSYNSQSNMAPLPCNDGFESSPDAGYYFDTATENITVIAGEGCTPPQPIYTFIGGVLGDSSGNVDKIWCLHDKDGSSTIYAQHCQTWPTAGDWANQEEFNPNQDYSEGLSIGFRLNHNTRVDNISPYVFGPLGPGAVNGGERGVQAQTSGDNFYVQAENKDGNKNITITNIYGNNAWLFSYHPNGSVTAYKNGSVVGSGDVGFVGSQVEKNGLFLGSRVPEDPNNFFKGSSITDFKIWNKAVDWSTTGY